MMRYSESAGRRFLFSAFGFVPTNAGHIIRLQFAMARLRNRNGCRHNGALATSPQQAAREKRFTHAIVRGESQTFEQPPEQTDLMFLIRRTSPNIPRENLDQRRLAHRYKSGGIFGWKTAPQISGLSVASLHEKNQMRRCANRRVLARMGERACPTVHPE